MADANTLRCPSCSGPLDPVVLACGPCGLRVEGRFEQNEFARLGPDELHLLRIFIRCEGSLREMESALGVSYPTIKSRLAALREKLSLTSKPAGPQAGTPPTPPPEAKGFADVLKELEEGKITYQEAMRRIREGER